MTKFFNLKQKSNYFSETKFRDIINFKLKNNFIFILFKT